MWEWHILRKSAGVGGFMYECGSDRVHVRLAQWHGLCKNEGVTGIM